MVRSGSPIRVYGIGGFYEASKPSLSRRSTTFTGSILNPVTLRLSSMTLWSRTVLPLSPDEKKLYVIDTGFTDGPDNPSHIRAFNLVVGAGKASNSKVFAEMPKPSITDGVRCDTEGHVWCSVGWGDPNEDGVRCYSSRGRSARQDPHSGNGLQPVLRRSATK